MPKILAIADDLTGAAEIAGLGQRYGLETRLFREVPEVAECAEGLSVVDTDTRLHPPAEAARVVGEVGRRMWGARFDLIYKKTDSVLRGPVRAEIEALLEGLGRKSAVLAPQNPSRGRVIVEGRYMIEGVELHRTAFGGDPEYPARSAEVREILGTSERISVCDACSGEELAGHAGKVTADCLPAGGADFFRALLEQMGLRAVRGRLERVPGTGATLLVCGSASAYSRELRERARGEGVAVCAMPESVLRQAGDVGAWAEEIREELAKTGRALVLIGGDLDRREGAARRLQEAIAEVVGRVIEAVPVGRVLVDGGATASAVCRRMGWRRFEVAGELADGVVHLKTGQGQDVLLKPGSYRWPEMIWKQDEA